MLLKQIETELQDLAEIIGKIEFGEILIEIKYKRVALISYKGEKRPKSDPKMLTKRPDWSKLDLEKVIKN